LLPRREQENGRADERGIGTETGTVVEVEGGFAVNPGVEIDMVGWLCKREIPPPDSPGAASNLLA